MTDEDFDAVISVHLRGTFTCVRAAVGQMREQGERRPDHLRRLARRPARQLRPDQLRRRQGGHRRHGAHLGDGAGARGHHRQRRRPGRRHRDDRDHPGLRAVRRGHARRRAAAADVRREGTASARRRTAPALVVFLASDAAARRHRPGDRHRRRPARAVVAPAGDRGRLRATAAGAPTTIAEAWPATFGRVSRRPSGASLPEAPR